MSFYCRSNLLATALACRYLLQVVNLYGRYLCKLLLQSPPTEAVFPFQQMSSLLLYLTHMFQSGRGVLGSQPTSRWCNMWFLIGSFRRVATAAMEAAHAESSTGTEVCGIEEMNEHFLCLAYSYPTLTVQWCTILTLLNYGEQGFWCRVLWPSSTSLACGCGLFGTALGRHRPDMRPLHLDV